jgi:hypothetical protein
VTERTPVPIEDITPAELADLLEDDEVELIVPEFDELQEGGFPT